MWSKDGKDVDVKKDKRIHIGHEKETDVYFLEITEATIEDTGTIFIHFLIYTSDSIMNLRNHGLHKFDLNRIFCTNTCEFQVTLAFCQLFHVIFQESFPSLRPVMGGPLPVLSV